MKSKILLMLGATTTAIAPVAAVISCGNNSDNKIVSESDNSTLETKSENIDNENKLQTKDISFNEWKIKYPNYVDKISKDGTTVLESAFSTFYETLPKDFQLPNSITTINRYAFEDATIPVGFVLPPHLHSLGDYVFLHTILPQGFTLKNTKITTLSAYSPFAETILPSGFDVPDSFTSFGSLVYATLPRSFVNKHMPELNRPDLKVYNDTL